MSSYSKILKRQAGATPKELAVIAGLIVFSLASAYGVVNYGLTVASQTMAQR